MKKVFTIAAVLFSSAAFAQTTIKIEELSAHIGDSVKVCTTIFGGRFFDKGESSTTLLNAGAAFPKSPLTLVIKGDDRKQYASAPEEMYKDKAVCITGKVILFREKPEIIIYKQEQIVLQ